MDLNNFLGSKNTKNNLLPSAPKSFKEKSENVENDKIARNISIKENLLDLSGIEERNNHEQYLDFDRSNFGAKLNKKFMNKKIKSLKVKDYQKTTNKVKKQVNNKRDCIGNERKNIKQIKVKKINKREREKRYKFTENVRILFAGKIKIKRLDIIQLHNVIPTIKCHSLKQIQILVLILGKFISKRILSMQKLIIILPRKEKDCITTSLYSNLMNQDGTKVFFTKLNVEMIDPLRAFQDLKKTINLFESLYINCLVEKRNLNVLIGANLKDSVNFEELTKFLKSFAFRPIRLMNLLMLKIFNQFFGVTLNGLNFFTKQSEFFFGEFLNDDFNNCYIIINSAIQAWHENEQPQNELIPMFDLLIKKSIIPWNSLQNWSIDGDWNDARRAAMFNLHQGQTFQEWCMSLQEKYDGKQE